MSLKTLVLVLVAVTSFAFNANAEKLDLESQTILINKIEATLVKLKPSDKSVDQLGLKVQLANLYAEKARLLIIEEGKVNCDSCQGSKKLRQNSVALYKEVLPALEGDFKAGVALQLAHLLELLNQPKAAIALYDDIIRNSAKDTSKSFLGKAYVNRGNAYFRQGQFIPAQRDFNEALLLIRPDEKGGVLHKIAWTFYNQGEISIAISQMKALLSQSKYLQQSSSEGLQYSESLHIELVHDLALFMAKSSVSKEEIEQLVKLTPESARIDTLLFLGDECDRLDNASSAIRVWQYSLVLPDFPADKKSIVRVKIARYYRETKQFDHAISEFHESLEAQTKCQSLVCGEYQPLAKSHLASWDKSIKSRTITVNGDSARALLRSYQDYNSHYQAELQTLIWQAQLARDIGQSQVAMQTYHQAADISAAQKQTKLTEESLLAEIALAEKINSAGAKVTAYSHYILLAPTGKQIWLVKFALANTNYDLKKYQEAAEIYALIAHQCNCRSNKDSIALKSAHLELDSLAKIDQPEKIENAAKDYANIYPTNRLIFYKIARNAGLKLASKLAASREPGDIAKSLLKLNGIPMMGATKAEKYSYYRLKMHLDELVLDFQSAYQISLALGMDRSNNIEDLVRVLTLAELSNHNNSKLIDKVINMKAPINDKKIAFVLKIRNSNNPWPLIEKYLSILRVDSAMFSDLLIENFLKTKDFNSVERYTRDATIVKTSNGSTLWRLVYLKKLGTDLKAIQAVHLVSSSDRLLASTFKQRLRLLKGLQQKVRKADSMKDWSAQVVSRSIYRTENVRLANEIKKLPMPKFLKAKLKDQYRKGLVAQAQPFVSEAVIVSQQMDELWQDGKSIDALIEDVRTQLEYRMLYVTEAKAVSTYAPEKVKTNLIDAINEAPSVPSEKQIIEARAEVREDPYNDGAILNLLNLEKAAGHKMMVAYLEGRRQFVSQMGAVK